MNLQPYSSLEQKEKGSYTVGGTAEQSWASITKSDITDYIGNKHRYFLERLKLDIHDRNFNENQICLSTLLSNKSGKSYNFKNPYELHITSEDGIFIVECALFGFIIYGSSRSEIYRELEQQFDFYWEKIVQQPNKNLAKGAIKVKNIFLENIECS